jgi:amidohydrolase
MNFAITCTIPHHLIPSPMPVSSAITALLPDIIAWRHDFHAHPELLYDLPRTSQRVADLLLRFGCDEVVTGIGQTGVVGVISGKFAPADGHIPRVIGLRSDMDALPILEVNELPYTSTISGKMHACGHDGHMAMLLGAAHILCASRNFCGKAVVIFQPAEEGGAGAKAMIDDGLMERFGIQEVYGMHNFPNIPPGHFAIRPGPMMASADRLFVEVTGVGGHAARPSSCIDPVLACAHIITALQSVVSRSVDPLDAAVVSITVVNAGTVDNVIPQSVSMKGTARSLDARVRDLLERRIKDVVTSTAQAFGATARIVYRRDYPVTVNHPAQSEFAASVARQVAGEAVVNTNALPSLGAEDFSFMLEKRPGAFIFIGNGNSANLHHPAYNFNDDIIPAGVGYWVNLVQMALAH